MPDTALNPSQRISQILERPLFFYHGWPQARIRERVRELLDLMSLPQDVPSALPSELPGGQKQRVCIARTLAAEPDVIVCDEVTSALDALVADEILTLLEDVQCRSGVGYLFITHDLGTVRRVADRVAVMLRGEIIAQGPGRRSLHAAITSLHGQAAGIRSPNAHRLAGQHHRCMIAKLVLQYREIDCKSTQRRGS